MRFDDDRTVRSLRWATPRLVRPDAILEIERRDGGRRAYLIEYDRTRRIDKNYGKFLRYDSFLCWWWRDSQLGYRHDPPFVLFVCQDDQQRGAFLHAADRELTGHLWHPSDTADHDFAGRDHILFATEVDMHRGINVAWRVPQFPRGNPRRHADTAPRGVRLPGGHDVLKSARSAA